MFLIIINGCAREESKETYKTSTKEIQKPQEISQNIKENFTSISNKEIFNEISNTDALDSSLEELDSVE